MSVPPNTLRIATWRELQDALYAGAWQAALERFRPSVAFRGMSRAHDGLPNGLARLGSVFPDLEGHLLRNFRKYAQGTIVPTDSVWNWLAVAQHHGLPTRLLDWTYSPYVAPHFATENLDAFSEDGIIWCVDYGKTNQLLPDMLQAMLTREGSAVFTADMLDHAAGSLHEFDVRPMKALWCSSSRHLLMTGSSISSRFLRCCQIRESDSTIGSSDIQTCIRRLSFLPHSNGRSATNWTKPISPSGCSTPALTA